MGFPSADAHQPRERLLQNPEYISWTTEGNLLVYDPAAQTWKATSLCLNSRVAGYSHLLHTSHQLIQKRQAKQQKQRS